MIIQERNNVMSLRNAPLNNARLQVFLGHCIVALFISEERK